MDERMRILELIESGEISAEEGARRIEAPAQAAGGPSRCHCPPAGPGAVAVAVRVLAREWVAGVGRVSAAILLYPRGPFQVVDLGLDSLHPRCAGSVVGLVAAASPLALCARTAV